MHVHVDSITIQPKEHVYYSVCTACRVELATLLKFPNPAWGSGFINVLDEIPNYRYEHTIQRNTYLPILRDSLCVFFELQTTRQCVIEESWWRTSEGDTVTKQTGQQQSCALRHLPDMVDRR